MTNILQTALCANTGSGLSFAPEQGPNRHQVAMLMAIRGDCQSGPGCPEDCEINLLLEEIKARNTTDSA